MRQIILIALLIFVASEAQADLLKVTGVYSNMRFGTEDVSGVEVFLTYSDKGYFAQIQCAEGAVSSPITVPVHVKNSFVEFSVPTNPVPNSYSCPSGKFNGEISTNGMKGQFEGTDWPGFLKRKNSYWQ